MVFFHFDNISKKGDPRELEGFYRCIHCQTHHRNVCGLSSRGFQEGPGCVGNDSESPPGPPPGPLAATRGRGPRPASPLRRRALLRPGPPPPGRDGVIRRLRRIRRVDPTGGYNTTNCGATSQQTEGRKMNQECTRPNPTPTHPHTHTHTHTHTQEVEREGGPCPQPDGRPRRGYWRCTAPRGRDPPPAARSVAAARE